MNLTDLPYGKSARIAHIEASDALTRKLLEMGLTEGMELTLMHVGPIRRDPIAIAIHDRCIALRRKDAAHIEVELVN